MNMQAEIADLKRVLADMCEQIGHDWRNRCYHPDWPRATSAGVPLLGYQQCSRCGKWRTRKVE